MSAAARRAHWRDLVERRLPGSARPDWPVRLDHCFARILLDNACGGPWRAQVRPPAHANMPVDRLGAAIALGEAVLAGRADLALLNRRSLHGAARSRAPGARRDPGRRPDPAPLAAAPTTRRSRALNADPAVMRPLPAAANRPARAPPRPASATGVSWPTGSAPGRGEPGGPFLGFAGAHADDAVDALPGRRAAGEPVELAWRLSAGCLGPGHRHPGRAARPRRPRGALRHRAVVAYTAVGNDRSRRGDGAPRHGPRRDFDSSVGAGGAAARPRALPARPCGRGGDCGMSAETPPVDVVGGGAWGTALANAAAAAGHPVTLWLRDAAAAAALQAGRENPATCRGSSSIRGSPPPPARTTRRRPGDPAGGAGPDLARRAGDPARPAWRSARSGDAVREGDRARQRQLHERGGGRGAAGGDAGGGPVRPELRGGRRPQPAHRRDAGGGRSRSRRCPGGLLSGPTPAALPHRRRARRRDRRRRQERAGDRLRASWRGGGSARAPGRR